MKDFPTQLVNSILFNTPKDWKKYPCQREPPRIGHYKGPPSGVQDWSQCIYQ